MEMKHVEDGNTFNLTVVYVKRKPMLRRTLWDALRHKSSIYTIPWCVIGDVNVIALVKENIRGIPYQMSKCMDFLSMIEDSGLVDLGYYGHKYTWSNASASSDHNPLFMESNIRQDNDKRYFKFLRCWVDNDKFMTLVEKVWSREVTSNTMWTFHQKLKALSNARSIWSRQEYRDIFQKAKQFEQQVKDEEMFWA
ncbi:uncharacterized protein LOC142180101 [Nicotiana tabacum]|uniref:Uncharacterized protein LOC142180101 n=1 Tax=Nicotiana tabacum TaxID=4097 RepID=A0AC58UCA9_TOBAC